MVGPVNLNSESNEQLFRTLEAIYLEAVDAIITIDERGAIESANPATEALFGYELKELVGVNIKILMPNPYQDAHDGYLKNYLDSGKRKIIGIGREVIGLRRDGTTFPIHLAVSEIHVGERRLFAGVIRDLSEFKRLEEQATRLGHIIDESLNEIFVFEAKTLRFLQANRGAADNLGYSIDELLQMTPVDIKPEYSEAAFREKIAPLIRGDKDRLEFETVHQRKDGSIYDVQVDLQKSTYRNSPVFLAIILDITQRLEAQREVERQRQAMQNELELLVETRTAELRNTQAELVRSEKYSTLGKVSGGIAHEIRNPLNAVKTSAYYLLNAKNASPEKVREHLERIDRQVSMIDNVVTALSDVARLPEANLTPVDLVPLIKNAVSSTKVPDNVQVVFQFPEDLPTVMVDENQIVIAIKNLIRNARDAMPDGGVLTISTEVLEDQVVFNFVDTGVGIASDQLGRILEPLYTTKARGMGLGLSITRAIADKNNCSLTIESEVGKGSKFGISLKRNK